jgi:hypothetical protein
LPQPGDNRHDKTGIRRAVSGISYAGSFLMQRRRKCIDKQKNGQEETQLLSQTEGAWEITQSLTAYTPFHREKETTNIMGEGLHGKAPDNGKEQSQREVICRNQRKRAKSQ